MENGCAGCQDSACRPERWIFLPFIFTPSPRAGREVVFSRADLTKRSILHTSMIAVTIQRHLVISRLPRRISSGISHFSTNRQSLGIGRAPIRVVKRKSDVAKPLRSPPQENPQENPRFPTTLSLPKSLLVEAEIAGKLSVSWHEAESILNEFDETELKSGSPKNLCSSENFG